MQTTTIQPLHVKALSNNEVRRFMLEEVSFENLLSTLKSLFFLPSTTTVSLKYLDDEQDWVSFEQNSELLYAANLTQRSIKIRFEVKEQERQPNAHIIDKQDAANETVVNTPSPCPSETTALEQPSSGRGGRGKGYCGRGAPGSPDRLSFRILKIQSQIVNEDIPERRKMNMKARLEKLQEIQAKQMDSPTPVPELEIEAQTEHVPLPVVEPKSKLADRIASTKSRLEKGDVPPHRIEAVKTQLAKLEQKAASLESKADEKVCKPPLVRRMETIQAQIDSGNLPAPRVAALKRRLELLQSKIENAEEILLAKQSHVPSHKLRRH